MAITFLESIAKTVPLVRRDERILEARSGLLVPSDRDLVRAVVLRGQGTAELSRITGRTPAVIRRRALKLLRHLDSPRFLGAARCLKHFSEHQAAVARLHLIQLHSLQATAARSGIPYHRVRQLLGEVRGIVRDRAGGTAS